MTVTGPEYQADRYIELILTDNFDQQPVWSVRLSQAEVPSPNSHNQSRFSLPIKHPSACNTVKWTDTAKQE